jgi:CBS domain-containing protein
MVNRGKVMSRYVATIAKDADIFDAIRMMVDGNITGMPVVDEDEMLVGMITERDVIRGLLRTQNTEAKVKDYMTTDIVTFNEQGNLLDIITALVENNFRRVPIESQGKLVGIISRRDIITYIFTLALEERGVLSTAIADKLSLEEHWQ